MIRDTWMLMHRGQTAGASRLDDLLNTEKYDELETPEDEQEFVEHCAQLLERYQEELASLQLEANIVDNQDKDQLARLCEEGLQSKSQLDRLEIQVTEAAGQAEEISGLLSRMLEPISQQWGEYNRLRKEIAYFELVKTIEAKSTAVKATLTNGDATRAAALFADLLPAARAAEGGGGGGGGGAPPALAAWSAGRRRALGGALRAALAPAAAQAAEALCSGGGGGGGGGRAAARRALRAAVAALARAQEGAAGAGGGGGGEGGGKGGGDEGSWALGAALLDPLTLRFRHHFLRGPGPGGEGGGGGGGVARAGGEEGAGGGEEGGTFRHAKPEWAYGWLLRRGRLLLPLAEGPVAEGLAAAAAAAAAAVQPIAGGEAPGEGLAAARATASGALLRRVVALARRRCRLTLHAAHALGASEDEKDQRKGSELFTHLVEETLIFEGALDAELGYAARAAAAAGDPARFPRVAPVLAAGPGRLDRWLAADAAAADRRLGALLAAEGAWEGGPAGAGAGASAAAAARGFAGLFRGVTQRYRYLQDVKEQLKFVTKLQKPLVMKFYSALYDRAHACDIYSLLKKYKEEDDAELLRAYCHCVNATWYTHVMLRDTGDDVFFIDLQKRLLQEGLAGGPAPPLRQHLMAGAAAALARKTAAAAAGAAAEAGGAVGAAVVKEVVRNEATLIGPTRALAAVAGGVAGVVKTIRGAAGASDQPKLSMTEEMHKTSGTDARSVGSAQEESSSKEAENDTSPKPTTHNPTSALGLPINGGGEEGSSEPTQQTAAARAVQGALEDTASSSLEGLRAVFEGEARLLAGLRGALLDDLAAAAAAGALRGHLLGAYLAAAAPGFQAAAAPRGPTEALYNAMVWLDDILGLTSGILEKDCFLQFIMKTAEKISSSLADTFRLRFYSENGGLQLQLDVQVIIKAFTKYSRRVESQFDKLLDLCTILTLPGPKLKSLASALTSVTGGVGSFLQANVTDSAALPERQAAAAMLEAIGVIETPVEAVQSIIALRLDALVAGDKQAAVRVTTEEETLHSDDEID